MNVKTLPRLPVSGGEGARRLLGASMGGLLVDPDHNRLILGRAGMPKIPECIARGTGGQQDGTDPSATYGARDGVMVAGDVRSYAREVCASGGAADYQQFSDLSQKETEGPWLAETLPWLTARFAGTAAPQDCSMIAPGNSLAPVTLGNAS